MQYKDFQNYVTVVGGHALISASWASLLSYHLSELFGIGRQNHYIYRLFASLVCLILLSRLFSNCAQKEIVFMLIVFAHVSI